MQEFWFYIELGLDHVLDFSAYDHILFLAALALPFTFREWKKVVILATVFTVAHCLSLALSVYETVTVAVNWIEFLIPVTIFLTALFNLFYVKRGTKVGKAGVHLWATAFFGLIHGFGFSNYFKMLMAEEENKGLPLLGFATGIELSQVLIILLILALAYVLQSIVKVKQAVFIVIFSIIVMIMTIPMMVSTFPL
ncbi:HupE/UreJ family protein [Flavobacteriaceae bacterium 3-367]|uniref:HupE/UreJ family protein n=1 Tax=Eudoraea algarum TaxID=3417568 RepID=UPI00327AEC1B